MKPIHFVFVMLLVIAGITGFVLVSDVPPGATGIPHPTVAGVSLGGSGADKLSAIGYAPYYFQVAVILLAGGLLYMGIPSHRRDGFLRAVMASGIAFALFVWSMLFFSYIDFTQTGQTTVAFGFPLPTNWMFWGVWGSFALFDIFYSVCFYRYFLHPDDEAAFNTLVSEMNLETKSATTSAEEQG